MNLVQIQRTPAIEQCLTSALKNIQDRNSQIYREVEKCLESTSTQYISASILADAYKIADKSCYFHELLSGSDLFVPTYVEPERNPELAARVERLKAEQADREYREMIKNVDLNRLYPNRTGHSFMPDMKSVQGQLITVVNVFLTIFGAFTFGYKAVEYSTGVQDFVLQISAGLFCAFLVAIADLYFLFKRLNKTD